MTNVLSFIPTDSHVCTTLGTNSDRTASGHDTSHGKESNKIIRHYIKELFNRNFKHDYIWTQHPMILKKRPKHESVNVLLRPLARFETDLWSRYPFNDSLNQKKHQAKCRNKMTHFKPDMSITEQKQMRPISRCSTLKIFTWKLNGEKKKSNCNRVHSRPNNLPYLS